MKIGYGSDIHWEFGPIELENPGCDVLILAGDVYLGERMYKDPGFISFMQRLSDTFKDVIVVAGNHEYYHGYWHKTLSRIRQFYLRFPNIHFLENGYIDINGVRFIGSTLWTNLDRKNPVIMQFAISCMNCYKLCRNDEREYRTITPTDVVRRHDESFGYIQEMVGKSGDCVVITHQGPSFISVSEKYRYATYQNFSYVSSLDLFMIDNPNIKLWVHGHIHTPSDYRIGNTRVLCNPRGYYDPLEDENFTIKVVDV